MKRPITKRILSVLMVCTLLCGCFSIKSKAADGSNGTMETAIDFSTLPIVNRNFTSTSSAYTVGFRRCSLSSETDEKWYVVDSCENGFFDIRGVSGTDINFEVYDKSGNSLFDSADYYQRPIEKYWKPTGVLGKTYVKVYCKEGGSWSPTVFYMSFGSPVVYGIRFNDVELRSLSINKGSYSYAEKDMSEVFTKRSTLESLYLTSTNTAREDVMKSVQFINPDSPWSERPQDNMIRNGIGTTDEIANVYDTRCGCTWRIGGKIDGGRNYFTTWIPRASGRFKEYYLGTLIEQHYFN